MTTSLDGKAAVVTGAAAGIGEAIALALAEAGAAVAVIDKDGNGAERTARRIEVAGARAAAIKADVTSAAEIHGALDEAERALDGLDVFVNNAGILRAGPLISAPIQDWDDQFAVNTRAAYLGMTAATRRMADIGTGGCIVAVTSNCARTPRMDLGAYCASKAAADMMARCLALEMAQYGIRVNSLCPGSCNTELQRTQWRKLGIGPEQQINGNPAKFRSGIPLGRLATPEDVAGMVVMLSSDASRFVTGQSICVDGGQTMP